MRGANARVRARRLSDLRPVDYGVEFGYLDACLEWEANFSLSSLSLQISAFMNRPPHISDDELMRHEGAVIDQASAHM